MKKLFTVAILSLSMLNASAAVFTFNGILMGTVCRNGGYFTVYPMNMAQPVGSGCPVRDTFGNIIGYGVVTAE